VPGTQKIKTHASVFALFEFLRGHYAAFFPENVRGSRISDISRLKNSFLRFCGKNFLKALQLKLLMLFISKSQLF
jgi:hypothetical protein